MVYSHDMADIGTCQTIQLLHLFCGIIAIIAHEGSSAKVLKMFLGIIGATILTFGGYLMAVGVCPECRLAHAKGFLYIISSHPLGDAVEGNGSSEELINIVIIDRNLHSLSAKYVRRSYQYWITQSVCNFLRYFSCKI